MKKLVLEGVVTILYGDLHLLDHEGMEHNIRRELEKLMDDYSEILPGVYNENYTFKITVERK